VPPSPNRVLTGTDVNLHGCQGATVTEQAIDVGDGDRGSRVGVNSRVRVSPTSETFATSHSHTQRSIRDRRPSGRLAQSRGAVADLPYSALALRAAAANASMVGYSRS